MRPPTRKGSQSGALIYENHALQLNFVIERASISKCATAAAAASFTLSLQTISHLSDCKFDSIFAGDEGARLLRATYLFSGAGRLVRWI